MFKIILVTIISSSASNSIIESREIQSVQTIQECIDITSRFKERKIILSTAQILTINMQCEKR